MQLPSAVVLLSLCAGVLSVPLQSEMSAGQIAQGVEQLGRRAPAQVGFSADKPAAGDAADGAADKADKADKSTDKADKAVAGAADKAAGAADKAKGGASKKKSGLLGLGLLGLL